MGRRPVNQLICSTVRAELRFVLSEPVIVVTCLAEGVPSALPISHSRGSKKGLDGSHTLSRNPKALKTYILRYLGRKTILYMAFGLF